MATTNTDSRAVRTRSLPVRAGLTAVLAATANAGLVAAAQAVGIAPEFRALTYPPVVFLSVIGALGAAGVYALLRDRVAEPAATFRTVAVAVLVVSFVPDLALLFADPAATPAGVVVLMAMHVVVAAVAVELLVSWRGER
ncbi:hypothetical protein I7X12_10725 [Halosimplex litoreum]|uniref:Uncharacterized protein n=1 Tax=Halosimplex litoreum TaxID=1198301 RepID=A0A7T3KTJ6_9EURY|nr:DUF6069 family protein [Halosimplex litoreum]QPV61244.1 hypothetical protein I7X12_10725 [Halosimplex litoreum]